MELCADEVGITVGERSTKRGLTCYEVHVANRQNYCYLVRRHQGNRKMINVGIIGCGFVGGALKA